MDTRCRSPLDLVQSEADQFRDPQPCGERQVQHRAIAQTQCGVWVWCVEQGTDFIAIEVADEGLVGLLHRDGANLPGLFEARWQSILQEAEERVDGGKSCIAGAGGATSFSLDVLEECKNKRRVELLDRKLGWSDAEVVGGKADQKLEGIGVGLASVRACLALTRQVFAEEGAELGGEHRHARTPRSRISPASATSRSNTGVASRYQ